MLNLLVVQQLGNAAHFLFFHSCCYLNHSSCCSSHTKLFLYLPFLSKLLAFYWPCSLYFCQLSKLFAVYLGCVLAIFVGCPGSFLLCLLAILESCQQIKQEELLTKMARKMTNYKTSRTAA